MIPIRDHLHTRSAPWVTGSLIALNTLVFLYQLGLPEWALDQWYYLWGIVPRRLLNPDWASWYGFPGGATLTLFTSMFLHGGWFHFLVNMWSLYLFGDDVEDRLGSTRYLTLYLLSGLIAGLSHALLFGDSTIPTIGASGAIAGIMGAWLTLFPRARIDVLVPLFIFLQIWTIPAAFYLPVWFLSQLLSGTLALAAPGFSGVAFWAHIGGFVAGMFLTPWLSQLATDRVSQSMPKPERVEPAHARSARDTSTGAARRVRVVFPDAIVQGEQVYVFRPLHQR